MRVLGILKIDQEKLKCTEEQNVMPNFDDNKISTVAGTYSLGLHKVQSLNAQCIGLDIP
jgi:hypothetical protein